MVESRKAESNLKSFNCNNFETAFEEALIFQSSLFFNELWEVIYFCNVWQPYVTLAKTESIPHYTHTHGCYYNSAGPVNVSWEKLRGLRWKKGTLCLLVPPEGSFLWPCWNTAATHMQGRTCIEKCLATVQYSAVDSFQFIDTPWCASAASTLLHKCPIVVKQTKHQDTKSNNGKFFKHSSQTDLS